MSKKFDHIRTYSKLHFVILFTFLIGFGNILVFSQNCKATLKVEYDRNAGSATENGADFWMLLKNTSSTSLTFNLSTINLKEPCNTKGIPTGGANVNLNVEIQTESGGKFSKDQVSVSSGKTLKFKVRVTVPNGTRFNSWSCVEVQAKSNNCDVLSSMLKVYVPDPSEG